MKSIKGQLEPLFSPKSVALVGISEAITNVSYLVLSTLLEVGFSKVYPVNPKGGEILGVKVYRSIRDIPGEVDLALLTVPKKAVPGILKECADKRVKGAILYTGGFSESGTEGRKFEEEVVRIARKGG